MKTIGIDAYGGDNSPKDIIIGSVQALIDIPDEFQIVLFGNKDTILSIIQDTITEKKVTNSSLVDRIFIVHTDDAANISMNCDTLNPLRTHKNSSMVKMLESIGKESSGDFPSVDIGVSAGNTGALVTASSLILGRVRNQDGKKYAPTLMTFIPQDDGKDMVMGDLGAMPEPDIQDYVNNVLWATAYLITLGNTNPKVGLLNIGTEAHKGPSNLQKIHTRLQRCFGDDFIGNVESSELLDSRAQIVVTDAFSGNLVLKAMEGASKIIGKNIKLAMTSGILQMLGSLLNGSAVKKVKDKFSSKGRGGALILGLEKPIVKAHGSSDAETFTAAIKTAYELAKNDILNKTQAKLKQLEVLQPIEKIDKIA